MTFELKYALLCIFLGGVISTVWIVEEVIPFKGTAKRMVIGPFLIFLPALISIASVNQGISYKMIFFLAPYCVSLLGVFAVSVLRRERSCGKEWVLEVYAYFLSLLGIGGSVYCIYFCKDKNSLLYILGIFAVCFPVYYMGKALILKRKVGK